jgi:hypothetical protein
VRRNAAYARAEQIRTERGTAEAIACNVCEEHDPRLTRERVSHLRGSPDVPINRAEGNDPRAEHYRRVPLADLAHQDFSLAGWKAADAIFTRWLAVHLERTGLGINALLPGFFMSEQVRFLHMDQKTGEQIPRATMVVGRTGTAMGTGLHHGLLRTTKATLTHGNDGAKRSPPCPTAGRSTHVMPPHYPWLHEAYKE